jgi:acetyl esterase
MHGGTFSGGDLDMPEADILSRELCALALAVVVSVDYRLAVVGCSSQCRTTTWSPLGAG